MTMTLYSGITIIYICLVIITAYSYILNSKHENFRIFGMNYSAILTFTLIATMGYCFVTALAIEFLKVMWTNIVFILCVVGAILFSLIICSGFRNTISEKMKILSIDDSIENITNKKEQIEKRILELAKIRDNGTTTPEARERTKVAIAELHAIRAKYNETLSELMVQKTLAEANMDCDCIEAIQLTSSKSVKDKLNFNLDKFDSSKEMEDSLSDVRNLMKNYK